MSRILPPGFSEREFEAALQRFSAVIGKPHVITTAADLESYLDPFAPGNAAAYAAAAVRPASTEQVQAIVRIAQELRIPLWTVSTGKNLAYGGAAPRLKGCVVLDLKRMNHVIEVNEELGYALVEPGVSYFDLYAYIRQQGYKLWIDPPAPGWGSVVGNTLERGFGYTPYGDHSAMQCGMEVVLANGELVRTGMGAMAGSSMWQLYKPGYGASYDGMFMQSNFGIVTKLGIWLMPQPESFLLCHARFRQEADLEMIVDTLRPLRLDGTIQNNAVIEGAVRWAAGISNRERWYEGDGAMPQVAIERMIRQLDIGWWTLRFALYGRKEVVDLNYRIARKALEKIPGADISVKRYASDTVPAVEPSAAGDKGQAGIPGLAVFQMLNWRGGNGAHIDFSPVCPATGRDAMKQYRMVKTRAGEYGFDYYGGFTAGLRHLYHIFAAIFDRGDVHQAEQAGELLRVLVEDAGKQGYAEYRSHLEYMDLVAAQYDFNDHALMRLSERIKDALDPAGILSPGKQGVWPASLRGKKT
ncbi:MAG: FAD-binding oxidoreductase [Sterolibacterium sp.]|nr:FAD-binding oxidoreductase [Sterolibacterium sp.]